MVTKWTDVIHQTQERVLPISKHRDVGRNNEMQQTSRCLEEEELFRVIDIASQTINDYWRNSKLKLTKFYDNLKDR